MAVNVKNGLRRSFACRVDYVHPVWIKGVRKSEADDTDRLPQLGVLSPRNVENIGNVNLRDNECVPECCWLEWKERQGMRIFENNAGRIFSAYDVAKFAFFFQSASMS